jgi:phenylalanyl-tRNA synthetase alpha chain
MEEKLLKIKKEILEQLEKIKNLDSLHDLEAKYLGRKGELTSILRGLVDLTDEAKKTFGKLSNDVKTELQNKFKEIEEKLAGEENKDKFVDATMPGNKIFGGHLHPLSQIQYELEDLFASLGFMIADGPELESDYYNFEALNIPKFHPARDMQDTFYIDKKNKEGEYDMVMRTHTSPVQIRTMQKYGAPLRCIVPGRAFRSEATDVRHEHTFYQLEGLMVDKDISITHLKGILETVAKYLFGTDTKVRLRPKFYPFVEPGINGEVSCFLCQGKGCRLCKNSGWLEIVGAGMVHPNVLKSGGVDPEKYTGYAFGFGMSRLAQLKYNIDDCRLYNSGDLLFLEQF